MSISKTSEVLANASHFFNKLGQNLEIKLLGASVLTLMSTFFSGLDLQGIMIAFMLIIADCVTGIIASVKTGEKIRSSKLTVTAEKIFIYGIMMLCSFLVDKQVGINIAQSATIFFVGATQFVSILENIGRAGYVVPSSIIKKLEIYTGKKHEK